MLRTLRLGDADRGAKPADPAAFLAPFHAMMAPHLQRKGMLRDEANSVWRSIKESPDDSVRQLQVFLTQAGFNRRPDPSGVFGYRTLASLRLFQEYVRSVEKDPSIGKPDGVAGPKVQEHIKRWQDQGLKCKWGEYSAASPSPEYVQWFSILEKVKKHFSEQSSIVLQEIEKFKKTSDTLKIADWDFDPNHIHLIGIRRNHEIAANIRPNDDLFILLLSGMVFKFWGSTDPNPAEARKVGRKDEPYLVEGQHLYRFGWHKISDEKAIYRALRPAGAGVLVFRNRDASNALTEKNIKGGVDGPNGTINIHWSGLGGSNWSAGCQVIAGDSYINDVDELVSCRAFAASTYSQLAEGKTRGAYNLVSDLVLSYAPPDVNTVRYTLGRETHLDLSSILGKEFAEATLKRLQQK